MAFPAVTDMQLPDHILESARSIKDETAKDGITVVIPTYNCKSLLARTLDSLCKQTLDDLCFEVIVVDDGSSDDTHLLASDYRRRLNLRYFFQDDKGFRVAAARNLGVRHARFEIVLFIDAGIVISPRLLATHCEHHRNASSLVLIGTSYGVLDYSTSCANLMNRIVRDDIDDALRHLSQVKEAFDSRTSYLNEIDYDLSRIAAPWLILWGGHVSVRARLIRSLGGFDESFNRWGGEDNELGIRLYQAGCTFQVLREVQSIHLPHEKNSAQKRFDARINSKYIHEKHGLRETALLIDHNWKCIVLGGYVATEGTACRCMDG